MVDVCDSLKLVGPRMLLKQNGLMSPIRQYCSKIGHFDKWVISKIYILKTLSYFSFDFYSGSGSFIEQ